jgi:polar amino acid transport system substrate-binding protein
MATQIAQSGGRRAWLARAAGAVAVSLACMAAVPAAAQTLDRIRDAGRIKLGYIADARPFTVRGGAGAEGYSAALCQRVADRVKTQLGNSSLTVEWVQLTLDNRLSAVQQGSVDLLCTPMPQTVAGRQAAAFSLPVFPAGVRAVLRNDAAVQLRESLAASGGGGRVVWRGSPAATVLGQKKFAVLAGSTTESWLQGRLASFQIDATVVPVPDYRTGLQQVLDHSADVFFGDRAVVLGAMDDAARDSLTILPRLLTHEPLALAMARGDDDFRLLVDRALSDTYGSTDFIRLYAESFGALDDDAQAFFRWNTLPQ